jgi:ligand-binding sensor domain-containing protein/signal transduction histidine kinase
MANRAPKLRTGDRTAVLVSCAAMLGLCPAPAVFALDAQRLPSRYGHDSWLRRDGLPQDFVQAITQTQDGYLWIGTLGGLVRFDGVRFTLFDSANTPGLKDSRITALCRGGGQSLWIGTAAGGVSRLERGAIIAFEPVGEPPDRSMKYVRSLFEARDGSLWVGTSGGGIRRFRNGHRVRNEEPSSPGHTITAIHEDHHGALWIGTTTEGITVLQRASALRYTTASGALPHNWVHAIYEDSAGAIWVGTRGGLTRIQDGQPTVFTRKNGFPAAEARAVWEDQDRNLWVGTMGQGLIRWSHGRFVSLAGEGSLSDDNVISLYEDQEGSLWVGTQKGLNRLKDVAFTSYSRRDGLSHEQVNSLLRSRDDSVWIGTDGGGLNRFKDGQVRVFTKHDGLGSDYIGPLFESRDGSIWVGGDGYISHIRRGRITSYPTDPAGQGHFVSILGEDAQDRLVVSIADQPLLRFDAGRLVPYHPATAARHYRFSMLRDREGTLWFGTVEGLARFKDGRYTVFTQKDGLPDDTVHSVYEDAEGTLWIATIGGLCRFRDGRFVSFAGRDGLGGGVVSQVLEDSRGELWMNGRRGIVSVRKEDLDAYAEGRASSIPFTVYGTGDGMESADYNPSYVQASACRTADGRLWFATTKGVASIDPLHRPLSPLRPPVVLEEMLADDLGVPLLPDAQVGPGRKRFEFHYTALSFVSPEKVRFRYMLEGFDSDWTSPHDRRVAYYTNLPPGRYRFRVKAANADGVWNEDGAAFGFQLRPRFHQTRSFRLLMVGLVALVGWSLHRLRLHRIEARFATVTGERNRMARELHDSLAQGLAGIALHAGALRDTGRDLSPIASRHLDVIGRLVRSSLDEARGSVWDLHPESLRQRDLTEALRSMVAELTGDTPVKAAFEVCGSPRPLGRLAERNIFRIGQEALTNAVKHSGACQVEMVLSFERARILLRVRDNGRGFDVARPGSGDPEGFGLISMRERAEQIGGHFSVTSHPGAGTEVVLQAPLP